LAKVIEITCGILVFFSLLTLSGCNKSNADIPAPSYLDSPSADQFRKAVILVEQDRGEPMGRAAHVEVPEQLKHYADSRRFLSMQIAEWRQHKLTSPHDFAEQVTLIESGELVQVPALGTSYILYGVGNSASDDLFTHYDKDTGDSIPLYSADADLHQVYAEIDTSLEQLNQTDADLKKQLQAVPRRDKDLAKRLTDEIAENGRSIGELRERRKMLDTFYASAQSRALLSAEYQTIAGFAQKFGGDLTDPVSRRELKVRLLSYLRPAALKLMEELAAHYQQKFDRPLAITSLMRPDEYQRELRRTNRNATLIDVPPHSTGLAFDVYYRYMSAAEQQFVMAELARLRENLNHYHVFVFIDGHPPDEQLITEALDEVGPAPKVQETPDKKETRSSAHKSRKATARKTSARKTSKTLARSKTTRRRH
jgi:hypothetical protein